MRTITYKVSDEVEKLLTEEQQQGESLNQTARRLMTAYLMQDGHTREVNQSIPGIPQDSVVMSRLEKLEGLLEELNQPQSNKVDQSVINGIKALESRLITLGDRVNALEKSDPLVSEFQPKYNERLDFIQDHLNALDALHFQDVDELEKRLKAPTDKCLRWQRLQV